jgi:hypothetical protein
MDLNILLAPLYGKGAKIEHFDERSLELGAIDYYQVVFDIEWQDNLDKTTLVTGHDRRRHVLQREGIVPLHMGHMFDLFMNQEKMLSLWEDWGYVVFDGCTIRRGDGALIVPCLRKLKSGGGSTRTFSPNGQLPRLRR